MKFVPEMLRDPLAELSTDPLFEVALRFENLQLEIVKLAPF